VPYIKSFKEKNLDISDLTDIVLEKYGILNSSQLELLSHCEAPWLKARKGLEVYEKSENIISKSLMKEYYSKLINK
jgi:uncharacterized phage-associated protein